MHLNPMTRTASSACVQVLQSPACGTILWLQSVKAEHQKVLKKKVPEFWDPLFESSRFRSGSVCPQILSSCKVNLRSYFTSFVAAASFCTPSLASSSLPIWREQLPCQCWRKASLTVFLGAERCLVFRQMKWVACRPKLVSCVPHIYHLPLIIFLYFLH